MRELLLYLLRVEPPVKATLIGLMLGCGFGVTDWPAVKSALSFRAHIHTIEPRIPVSHVIAAGTDNYPSSPRTAFSSESDRHATFSHSDAIALIPASTSLSLRFAATLLKLDACMLDGTDTTKTFFSINPYYMPASLDGSVAEDTVSVSDPATSANGRKIVVSIKRYLSSANASSTSESELVMPSSSQGSAALSSWNIPVHDKLVSILISFAAIVGFWIFANRLKSIFRFTLHFIASGLDILIVKNNIHAIFHHILELRLHMLGIFVWVDLLLDGLLDYLPNLPQSELDDWNLRQRKLLDRLHARRIVRLDVASIKLSPPAPRALFASKHFGQLQPIALDRTRSKTARPLELRDLGNLILVKKLWERGVNNLVIAENRVTGETMLVKSKSRKTKETKDLLRELSAMTRAQGSVWCPSVFGGFTDDDHVHIFMAHYPRGNLQDYMTTMGGLLNRPLATFYLAELFVAIRALHKLNIVHRDIIPQNILLDEDGHLVISNFSSASTPGQTPRVLEPEMDEYAPPSHEEMDELLIGLLATSSYTEMFDFYNMGIVYYQMVTGQVPVLTHPTSRISLAPQPDHIQDLTEQDRSFLSKLLKEYPHNTPPAREIRKHPIFDDVQWRAIQRKRLRPPAAEHVIKRRASSEPF